MLIFSKFHDYYDLTLRTGIDTALMYKRETTEISLNKIDELYTCLDGYPIQSTYRTQYEAIPVIIGVCGNVHLYYKLSRYNPVTNCLLPTICVNDIEGIENFLTQHKLEMSLAKFNAPKTKHNFDYSYKPAFRRYTLTTAFERITDKKFQNIFALHKTPLFVISYGRNPEVILTLNPCMKNYNMQKFIDPYTMFQEISMFLGGVLGVGEPTTANISDKDMSHKKGFDDKSFKTVSPGKKFNRRQQK